MLTLLFGVAPFSPLPSSSFCAETGLKKNASPPAWQKGIDYLETALTSQEKPFDVQKVSGLLDFVTSAQGMNPHLDPGPRGNATGAYFFSNVNVPLSRVVQYSYNPKIPAYVTLPSVVRLGGWLVKPDGPFEGLWQKVGKVREPLVMRGVEYEEITPDLTTGSYYRYDMDRLMVLLRHGGRDFFISVTGQQKPSTVGRKGAIIGPDSDWNYFYSGQKGLSKSGLGWVSSYLYDAFSVSIMFEPDPTKAQTRYANFKWLRAGWNGINMVKRDNIVEGCQRFAQGFKSILESPQLPEAEQLIDTYSRIRSLSNRELAERLQPIGKTLKLLCQTDPALARNDFQEQIKSGGYLTGMSREEREHLLMSESLKLAIGKKSFLEKQPR